MPGPPPPPPPANLPPVCPPPPAFNLTSTKGDPRGALLQSIRQGTKLKKAVTNDRSAPAVVAKAVTNSHSNLNSSSNTPMTISNGVGLGGLFADGMPKLKPIGKQSGVNNSNSNTNCSNSDGYNFKTGGQTQSHSSIQRHFIEMQNDVQSALKKQMATNSNRNRGPPPPAPTRNISQSMEYLQNSGRSYHSTNGSSNGLHLSINSLHRPASSPHQSPTSPNPSFSILQANSSTLHRKANSSANLSAFSSTDGNMPNRLPTTPSNRKPNLAPKPPILNGKPAAPPKRLIINGRPSHLHRAQSMKSPRTPSPQSPEEFNYASKFGTVRNISAVLDKSLGHKTRPTINSRPTAPPPLVPSQQTPPPNKIGMVKPPNHAPPPPPNTTPQPPIHAPPPPPQRGNYQVPTRTSPAVPLSSNAPPPPPRYSSMRDLNGQRTSLDLDYKFRNEFHSVSEFPQPGPYRAIAKFYSNQQESAC